ncbi:MAG: hypothetical protein R2804_11370 [Cyclobacteriaceae bacterium]
MDINSDLIGNMHRREHILPNLEPEDLKRKVYRVIPFHRLLHTLIESHISFVKPLLWDDPYEAALLKSIMEDEGGNKYSLSWHAHNVFANCWTFNSDHDYCWRVYGESSLNVQIQTTIEKIFYSFSHHILFGNQLFQVGKVKYKTWEELKSKYEGMHDAWQISRLENNYNLSLFDKRIEFEHEDEVRAILRYPNEPQTMQRMHLSINVNEFIESIMLGPKIGSDFSMNEQLIRKLGYHGEINQSQIYSIPDLKIKLKGDRMKEGSPFPPIVDPDQPK